MPTNVECHIYADLLHETADERENKILSSSQTSITYFASEFHGERVTGRKKIYICIKKRTEIRKNASQPTEFKNEFLQKQKCTQLFPAGNTRFLPF